MEYLLPLAILGLTFAIITLGVLWRREMRAQVAQVLAIGSALKGASDKSGARIGRITDRTERLEKMLLELVDRVDASMSIHGVDLRAYQDAKRDAAIGQMRELLVKGDEVEAIRVWRKATGLGMADAFAMVDHLEHEMSAAHTVQIICSPGETAPARPEIRNGAMRTN